MKKALALVLAVICSMFFTLQASATDGVTPPMGDSMAWLWVVIAAVAAVLIVVVAVTGKRR